MLVKFKRFGGNRKYKVMRLRLSKLFAFEKARNLVIKHIFLEFGSKYFAN